MLKKNYILASVIGLAISTTAAIAHQHLELDLSSQEYHDLWQQKSVQPNLISEADSFVIEAINGGEKLSQWLELINRNRTQKIYLTSADTRNGIPIDKPNIYGPKQIKADLSILKKDLPKVIRDVVYGDEVITENLPLESVDDFIKYGRMIDRLYQTAVRWQVVIVPEKAWYQKRQAKDVRGFYHLSHTADLDKTLLNYNSLNQEQKTKFKQSLWMICVNANKPNNTCRQQLSKAIENPGQLVAYKNQYWPKAQKNWDSFFKIKNPRHDVLINGQQMSMPFKTPDSNYIQQWLKQNVEDEFRFNDWHFRVNFTANALSHLEFEANTTPHVSDGNTIVMDKNTPLDEYEVKWTIRHEYGHVLRLPDCYMEFYDASIDSAVNYQLDISDLMCSRAGNMNQRIYQELISSYARHG